MISEVRRAVASDAARLSEIRASLALTSVQAPAAAGGFLLGSAAETYSAYIAGGCVMVVESRGAVVAFSVVLPDALLRRSEVYAKRHSSTLPPALLTRLERSKVAYFDQLAAVPRRGLDAAGLAYRHLLDTFESHDAVIATTVVEPVENRAAVPFLAGVGFRAVGFIDEEYPQVGRIRSRLFLADSAALGAVRATPLAARYERRLARPV